MKFKALRMALAVGFLVTTAAVVAVTMIEHSLLAETSARIGTMTQVSSARS